MQSGTRRNAELVEGKPEARLMSHTELAAKAESRSWTTPVELTNPGNWPIPAEEMGPQNLTGTSEEEGLRMGPEPLTIRTGPAKKTKM